MMGDQACPRAHRKFVQPRFARAKGAYLTFIVVVAGGRIGDGVKTLRKGDWGADGSFVGLAVALLDSELGIRDSTRDIGAITHAAFEIALGDQLVEGAHHRVARDTERVTQITRRRQACAGGELAL